MRTKAAEIAAAARTSVVDREGLAASGPAEAAVADADAASATGLAGTADRVQRARAARKIRGIVSHLMYAEGHSAGRQGASLAIVDAVNTFHKDEETAGDAGTEQRHAEAAKKRDTTELHARIAALNHTISKESARHAAQAKARRTPPPPMRARSASGMRGRLPICRRCGSRREPGCAPRTRGKRMRGAVHDSLEVVASHCFNGLKDGGEAGVDCGGECPRQYGMVEAEEIAARPGGGNGGGDGDGEISSVQMLPRHELWEGQDQTPTMVAHLDCGKGDACTHPERAVPSMPTVFIGDDPNAGGKPSREGWREVSESKASSDHSLRFKRIGGAGTPAVATD